MPLIRRWFGAAALVAAAPLSVAVAQERRSLPSSAAESQLMGYYAAVMHFTPVGLPDAAGHWELGGVLAYIPDLPAEDRRVGFGGTKLEESNLCPVYPRLTAARRFGKLGLEAGWTPPLEVCGVEANIGALAVSWTAPLAPAWRATLRGSAVAGSLEAAITCPAAATQDAEDQACFGGTASRDQVKPLTVALDAVLSWRGLARGGVHPYLLLGVRRERIHFDVHYTRTAGGPLPALDDNQRLGTTLTRVHAAAGASLAGPGPLRLGGELYYAPGALLTVRGRAAVLLGRAR
jgi:hypothetical protein